MNPGVRKGGGGGGGSVYAWWQKEWDEPQLPKRDGERDLQHGLDIFQLKRHKKELQSNLSTAATLPGTEKSSYCTER